MLDTIRDFMRTSSDGFVNFEVRKIMQRALIRNTRNSILASRFNLKKDFCNSALPY